MYYYIKGILVKKGENYIVVDAGGVGYMINTSYTSMTDAGEVGREVTVYTYLHVREDVMELFGFTTLEEKTVFLQLLSVSGVGPKAALSILSVVAPAQLALAVMTDDVKAITKASGVGPKMAQRIVLELKDKLKTAELDIPSGDTANEPVSDSKHDAVSALVALGYSVQEAQSALKGVDNTLSTEDMVKKALMSLF